MGYHGILWASMGIKFKLSNVLVMFDELMVHKPGSVNLFLKVMIINLEQMSPFVSSSLPE